MSDGKPRENAAFSAHLEPIGAHSQAFAITEMLTVRRPSIENEWGSLAIWSGKLLIVTKAATVFV
jgi:hypothetical protein